MVVEDVGQELKVARERSPDEFQFLICFSPILFHLRYPVGDHRCETDFGEESLRCLGVAKLVNLPANFGKRVLAEFFENKLVTAHEIC